MAILLAMKPHCWPQFLFSIKSRPIFLSFVIAVIGSVLINPKVSHCQNTENGPSFLPGGDLSGFRIKEDTKVGSIVYQLRVSESTTVHHHYLHGKRKLSFYISGDAFSVAKDTGVVTLIRGLDREKEDTLDVIITVVEESLPGKPENTLSIKREIVVEDANDNSPVFIGAPFKYSVQESVKVFTTIIEGIKVTDSDVGSNAQVDIKCSHQHTPLACETFQIHVKNPSSGLYLVSISLRGSLLNYELVTSYDLELIATDKGGLQSRTNVTIDVTDVQDEPPKFLNGPYSITVNESTPLDVNILTIIARDGDDSISIRHDIKLELLNDVKGYFKLARVDQESWSLMTGNNVIDREDPEVLLNGGIYMLTLRATELVGDSGHGAISFANITVVIQDINDQEPKFNLNQVQLTIPEDLSDGAAVPGLNLIVSDLDAGHNAKFALQLEDIDPKNSITQVFSVSPAIAMGRTPVIIKLIDSRRLDYEDEKHRNFVFYVVAIQENIRSSSLLNFTLKDVNDNYPTFNATEYHAQVPENLPANQIFYSVKAHDRDSEIFGQVTYHLKGFGAEKFQINSETGDISVAHCLRSNFDKMKDKETPVDCLDFETQPTYSLRIEAIDGGGKKSTANLHIQVTDVNDNAPKFVRSLYVRELHEKDSIISPPLVLKAIDSDGQSQSGSTEIRYRVKWTNLTGLTIDPISGEVKLTNPIQANFARNPMAGMRKKLNYKAVIEAIDGGNPPLTAEASILMHVRSKRDGEPIFINEPYSATVKENAQPGTVILQIKATDPDGPDSQIRYSIVAGAKDSFLLDPKTGELKVGPTGDLDRDLYGDQYVLTVSATDSGAPYPLTSTSEVTIYVEDVNNKPPRFNEDVYVAYLSDKQIIPDFEVTKVKAIDPDSNALIRYNLDIHRIRVHDKTGALLIKPSSQSSTSSSTNYFSHIFKIDPITGSVRVNNSIDPERASIIVIPIVARDINDPTDGTDLSQIAQADLTVYIQSQGDKSPIFSSPWSPTNPTYEITIPEEMPIGSTLLTLAAKNPATGKPVTDFRKIESTDPDNLFAVAKSSGLITLNSRLDYEQLVVKQMKFAVEAYAEWFDDQTGKIISSFSLANILINVIDINDNSPRFLQDFYQSSILESSKWPQHVLTVQATDKDSGRYGNVVFSLSGDGSSLFEINNRTGAIRVRHGVTLDRESKSSYNLQVTAFDNVNSDGADQNSATSENDFPANHTDASIHVNRPLTKALRRTTVFAKITLVDINDNPPKFSQESYDAVIPENLNIGTKIGFVHAADPDEGSNGMVMYEISYLEHFSNPKEVFFRIDPISGEIFVDKSLSGKGRSEPYVLHIRAFDNGQPQLSSSAKYSVIIGDIAANDGIPRFVRPAENEVIYITENAKPGTFVYQVEAIDADNKNSPNGKVMYKFAEPSLYFDIDSVRGSITTSRNVGRSVFLDRERNENFTFILVAFDLGSPPQESQRVIVIRLNDTDDNQPHFSRSPNDPPMEFFIDEQLPLGSEIGVIKAIDEDSGLNAAIAYQILSSSHEGLIALESKDGLGHLKVNATLDREQIESVNLLIQAKHPSKVRKILPHEKLRITYQASDLSQLRVKVKLNDIDDNPPKFEKNLYVEAIQWDLPLNSDILTFVAKDPDISDREKAVEYKLIKAEYFFNERKFVNMSHVFDLHKDTGVLRNDILLKTFVDGHFVLSIEAKSVLPKSVSTKVSTHKRSAEMISVVEVKIFVLRGSDMVKFVFNRSPNYVQQDVEILRERLQKTLHLLAGLEWRLNFQETHFQERKDGSLDFESSSMCFQVFKVSEGDSHGHIVSFSDAIKPLRNSSSVLKKLYENFGIMTVEECVKPKTSPLFSKQEFGVVLIALFIAFFSVILAFIASGMKKNFYKRMSAIHSGRPIVAVPDIKHPYAMVNTGMGIGINHDRIHDWQDSMNPPIDAVSARSFPTMR